MRRSIYVKSGNENARIIVTAKIVTNKMQRHEVETMVDEVATGIMRSLEHVAYAQTPINRMVLR